MHHRIYLIKTPGGTYVVNRPGGVNPLTQTPGGHGQSPVGLPVPVPPQPVAQPDTTPHPIIRLIGQRLEVLEEQKRWIERLGRSVVASMASNTSEPSGRDEESIHIDIAEAFGAGSASGTDIEFPAWLVEGMEGLPNSVDISDCIDRLDRLRTEGASLDAELLERLQNGQP